MRITKGLYSSETDLWATPQELFDRLDAEFHFTLDACATPENAKCVKYYTPEQDGLKQPWVGTVWCNPPYGRKVGEWARKAYEESQRGATVVMLVFVRTDTRWFHDYVYGKAELRFIKGRLRFGGLRSNAPFPSMLCIYRPKEETKE